MTNLILHALIWQVVAIVNLNDDSLKKTPIETIGLTTKIELGNQVEGKRVDVVTTLVNKTDFTLTELEAHGTCSCVSGSFAAGTTLEPGGELALRVKIMPPKDVIREQIQITGKVAGPKSSQEVVQVLSLAFSGICYPPLRPNDDFFLLDDKSQAEVFLIPASPAIEITDLSQVKLQSKYLEVKKIEKQAEKYRLQIGPMDGVEIPNRDVAALITAPFSYPGASVMLMEEQLNLLRNARLEVAPNIIRFGIVPHDEFAQYRTYSATVVLRNFTGRHGDFHALLVVRKNDHVVVVDPDIIYGIDRVGKSNAYRLSLAATVYNGLASDDDFFVAFHQGNFPMDLTLSWEAFANRFDVFATSVQ